jgi:hypothetical protein
LCGTQNLAKSKSKQRRPTVPDFTIPAVLLFLLFLGVLLIYKLALAVVVGIEILRGKR